VEENTDPVPDEDIAALVARLARPDGSGGKVIESAAIMAEGSRSAAILDWLRLASWTPEEVAADTSYRGGGGLHGTRRESDRADARAQKPRRYISPRGA
jgi:hypothetical protein